MAMCVFGCYDFVLWSISRFFFLVDDDVTVVDFLYGSVLCGGCDVCELFKFISDCY